MFYKSSEVIDIKDILLIYQTFFVSFPTVLLVVYVKAVKNGTGHPAWYFENGQNTNAFLYFLINYFLFKDLLNPKLSYFLSQLCQDPIAQISQTSLKTV